MWDGGTARQLGLVDGFGGMDEAIAKAAELAKLDEDDRGVTYLEHAPRFTDELMLAFAGEEESGRRARRCAGDAGAGAGSAAGPRVAELRSILSGPDDPGRAASNARRSRPRRVLRSEDRELAGAPAQLGLTRRPLPFLPLLRLIVSGSRMSASITMPSDSDAEAHDPRVVRVLAALQVHDVQAPHQVVEAPPAVRRATISPEPAST